MSPHEFRYTPPCLHEQTHGSFIFPHVEEARTQKSDSPPPKSQSPMSAMTKITTLPAVDDGGYRRWEVDKIHEVELKQPKFCDVIEEDKLMIVEPYLLEDNNSIAYAEVDGNDIPPEMHLTRTVVPKQSIFIKKSDQIHFGGEFPKSVIADIIGCDEKTMGKNGVVMFNLTLEYGFVGLSIFWAAKVFDGCIFRWLNHIHGIEMMIWKPPWVENRVLSVSYSLSLGMFLLIMNLGTRLDHYSFSSVLDACAGCSSLVMDNQIHSCILKFGVPLGVILVTSLVDMYGKCEEEIGVEREMVNEGEGDVLVEKWVEPANGWY